MERFHEIFILDLAHQLNFKKVLDTVTIGLMIFFFENYYVTIFFFEKNCPIFGKTFSAFPFHSRISAIPRDTMSKVVLLSGGY